MARIGAVGEVCEDVYLPDGVARPGGIAANFAFHAGALGAEALLVGAVGDDEAGARLRAALRHAPVDASRVRTLPGASTVQRLRLEAGERIFCGYDAGVCASFALDDDDERALRACDVLACSDGLPVLLERCLALGPPVAGDFSRDTDGNAPGRPDLWLAPWLDRLTIAFVGGEPGFAGTLAALSRRTTTLIVLTAGAAGAFAFRRGEATFEPSHATSVVDTTGCGDAFQAAFTVAWAAGAPLEASLVAGAARAAIVAAAFGAQGR